MKLDLKTLPAQLSALVEKAQHYTVILFIVLIAIVYGYLLLHIGSLNNVPPAQSTAQAQAVTPHIDPSVVKQLQQLQDNSVSVKTLFDQARSNPFQE